MRVRVRVRVRVRLQVRVRLRASADDGPGELQQLEQRAGDAAQGEGRLRGEAPGLEALARLRPHAASTGRGLEEEHEELRAQLLGQRRRGGGESRLRRGG